MIAVPLEAWGLVEAIAEGGTLKRGKYEGRVERSCAGVITALRVHGHSETRCHTCKGMEKMLNKTWLRWKKGMGRGQLQKNKRNGRCAWGAHEKTERLEKETVKLSEKLKKTEEKASELEKTRQKAVDPLAKLADEAVADGSLKREDFLYRFCAALLEQKRRPPRGRRWPEWLVAFAEETWFRGGARSMSFWRANIPWPSLATLRAYLPPIPRCAQRMRLSLPANVTAAHGINNRFFLAAQRRADWSGWVMWRKRVGERLGARGSGRACRSMRCRSWPASSV